MKHRFKGRGAATDMADELNDDEEGKYDGSEYWQVFNSFLSIYFFKLF